MGRQKREPMSKEKKNIIVMMLESGMDEHLGYHEYKRSDNPDYINSLMT